MKPNKIPNKCLIMTEFLHISSLIIFILIWVEVGSSASCPEQQAGSISGECVDFMSFQYLRKKVMVFVSFIHFYSSTSTQKHVVGESSSDVEFLHSCNQSYHHNLCQIHAKWCNQIDFECCFLFFFLLCLKTKLNYFVDKF